MRFLPKKLQAYAPNWRSVAAIMVVITLAVGLLGYKLSSLTVGMSAQEVQFVNSASTIQSIMSDPLFLPQKLPLLFLHAVDLATPWTARLVSTGFALASAVLLYLLIKQWHTRRMAVITSALFVSSSWFLQVGRIASPQILYIFFTLALIYMYTLKSTSSKKRLAVLIAIVSTCALYVPGMVLLVATLALIRRKLVLQLIKTLPAIWQILLLIALSVLIAPLLYAVAMEPLLGIRVLGITAEFVPIEWLKRVVLIPVFLSTQGPYLPNMNLGRLPLLDVFSLVMVVLGGYWYYFRLKMTRTLVLLCSLGVTAFLMTFGGLEFIVILLPLTYIVMAAGLSLLLQQWSTVFPKNPLARIAGTVMIALAIVVVGNYHIQRYFVAWSGSQATNRTFIHQLR